MNLKKIITCIILLTTFTFISCTEEEEEENCTETVCPDGFNNCFEKPCE